MLRARRNYPPLPPYSSLHRGAEDSASGYRSSICTSICIPAASQNTTCLAQFIVHWLQSERGGEGKNFAALKFYYTVTLAVYPSDLCIREHLSKRAVVSPVAISASSSALSLIYATKDERGDRGAAGFNFDCCRCFSHSLCLCLNAAQTTCLSASNFRKTFCLSSLML